MTEPLEFRDISTEKFRVYTFPGGEVLRIDAPQQLHVSESGGHRVIAAGGSYYVAPKWLYIRWEVMDGAPAISF